MGQEYRTSNLEPPTPNIQSTVRCGAAELPRLEVRGWRFEVRFFPEEAC